jgi:hypothetical protein
MSPRTADIESLTRRFRSRLSLALSLLQTYRFITELEPPPDAPKDPFLPLGEEFMSFRLALHDEDPEAGLDAVERIWTRIESCRKQVIERDSTLQAYRVRWACENAPLRPRTVDSLGRFYRLAPYSTGTQSKYEYVLTRHLAGPIGPERKLPPTHELIDTVVGLERAWQAFPVEVEDEEVATIALALKSFASEAARQPDAAAFTTSALMRRFGSFKASIGEKLFDPRLTVAVVEANVAVLNVLNRLLAEVGGQPFAGFGPDRRSAPRLGPPVPVARAETATPSESSALGAPASNGFYSQQIQLSGMGLRRSSRSPQETPIEPARPSQDTVSPQAPAAAPSGGLAETQPSPLPEVEPAAPATNRQNIKTSEIDLSGLEIEVREAKPVNPSDEAKDALPGKAADGREEAADRNDDDTEDADESSLSSDIEDAAPTEAEQQPSRRAYELAAVEENAAIIEQYLKGPRSPEVWQLDLDTFLGMVGGEVLNTEAHKKERRLALELILAADDLICLRETQDGAPSADHKAKVKSVSSAMLLLRASLHRSTNLAAADPKELELLLYVSDHLLWERLRLEASLKRKPRRRSSDRITPPRRITPFDSVRIRFKRHRRIVVGIASAAAMLTLLSVGANTMMPTASIDPEVGMVALDELEGMQVFDEGRGFRGTLFVTASRAWTLLDEDERRDLLRSLGAFATERGFRAVSVFGENGDPVATFKDDEALLESDLTKADAAASR